MRISVTATLMLGCFVLSVLFCLIAWIMAIRKSRKAIWASLFSLTFVAISVLMEYRIVLDWIQQEDWSALMDVVPSTYKMLCGYVIILFIMNIYPITKSKN